tara:strand:- start:1517 stop:1720 length:204 start_codon:yes stop_codon:yes gene_type:complete
VTKPNEKIQIHIETDEEYGRRVSNLLELEKKLEELEVPNDIHYNDEIPDYQGILDMADDLLGGNNYA